MKINKALILLSISLISIRSYAHSFAGHWEWNEAPNTRTFSIDLRQHANQVEGRYCAVAQNGNKIDCDEEEGENIKGTVNVASQTAIVEFSSFFGATHGKAQLLMEDGHLRWRIVKEPCGGDFYAPKEAVMDRTSP